MPALWVNRKAAKTFEHFGETVVGLEQDRPQLGGRAGRRAILGKPAGDQRVIPIGIAKRQDEAGENAERHEQGGGADVPSRGADGGGKAAAEERRDAGGDTGASAVDIEVRARGQAFEIADHVAVERDRARHRERGQARAIELGQAQNLGRGERA